MTDLPRSLTSGPIKALLVSPTSTGTWMRELTLPIPPSVGMGIRLDTYVIVNVDSVIVGDDDRWQIDVTCIVSMEGGNATAADWERLGFESGVYV